MAPCAARHSAVLFSEKAQPTEAAVSELCTSLDESVSQQKGPGPIFFSLFRCSRPLLAPLVCRFAVPSLGSRACYAAAKGGNGKYVWGGNIRRNRRCAMRFCMRRLSTGSLIVDAFSIISAVSRRNVWRINIEEKREESRKGRDRRERRALVGRPRTDDYLLFAYSTWMLVFAVLCGDPSAQSRGG